MMAKILIAEDEQALAQALQMKLTNEGFEVEIASDGEDAYKKLSSSNDIDVVLLDVIMPKMNGFEILEKLKADGFNKPIIVTSNLGQEEDIKKAESLGAKKYLVKSNAQLSEIVDTIKSFVK